ncbi:hypothetical protein [Gluconobacter oxydans]|uniref:hypothetical protein n=1 Tax=Gluconobacter oxydans TaxID=442 RepID=UPI002649FF0A|nr:hypothetical protein [Gluconobacter oxydans]WKE49054.1 hypothetical protein NUJ38_04890 [Gluconobacter oxydans]
MPRFPLHILRFSGWMLVSCAMIRLVEALALHWDAWAAGPPFLLGAALLYITSRKD